MQAFPKLGRAVVVAAALVLPSVALAEPPAGDHPAETAKPKHANKSKDKKEHKEGDAAKKHEATPKPEAN